MPNLNSGTEWSEMDIEDLISALAYGRSIEETADFLCRDADEVREKIKEPKMVQAAERNLGQVVAVNLGGHSALGV